jgi:hypothetical protein
MGGGRCRRGRRRQRRLRGCSQRLAPSTICQVSMRELVHVSKSKCSSGEWKHTPFPDDDHCQNAGSDGKVEGNHPESCSKRIFPFQDAVFGDGEDDDCESTGYRRSYHPSSEYLRDSLPSPDDPISTKGGNANADDSTDYAVT